MTDQNLITVSDIGKFAPEINTGSYDAPTLSGMITDASKIVSDYLMYTPLAENIVDEVKNGMITSEGDLLIFPNKLPIVSVSAINIFKGPSTVALTLQDSLGVDRFNIDYQARHIRFSYDDILQNGTIVFDSFYSLRSAQFYTKISYRGGWEPSQLPGSIRHATVLIVKDILSEQYNSSGASRISQGSLSLDFSIRAGQSKIVQTAFRLLNPYRRIG